MTKSYNFRELASGSFIYALDDALDKDICAGMIAQFEAREDQQVAGRIGQRALQAESIKQSTDLRISGREDWLEFDKALQHSLSEALRLIAEVHPFFKMNPLHDVGYNLQRTLDGKFYHWHIDGGGGRIC